MKIIVISNPVKINDEINILISLFKHGLKLLHLRKPDFTKEEYQNIIKSIPKEYHNNIVIHSHYELTNVFNLKGIHLPEYTRTNFNTENLNEIFSKYNVISSSFHNLNDLSNINNDYEYVFLSPIFNSISKNNYNTTFKINDISSALKKSQNKIIALGGINLNNAKQAINMGFSGIALHGTIWSSKNPINSFIEIINS